MRNGLRYERDFVEKNLIAYIGNKRKLIPLICRAIEEIKNRGSQKINDKGLFLDFFAGTGVVSRLAKSLGFKVHSNDWETYSYIINKTYIEENQDIFKLFMSEGGINKVLEKLNALDKPNDKNGYIAKYYCPQNDELPDTLRERLFYTQQNGILIDNIRTEIDNIYPSKTLKDQRKKDCLLSALLYETSVRSNTNGVFKGFHCGFGGLKKDALGRIKKKLKLTKPILSKRKNLCKVTKMDALSLAKKLSTTNKKAEIVYLDPPYNQHQYGSNYHLLNTIAINDKPVINKEFFIGGKKIDKSAIRKDWHKTKSNYCYKATALVEFKQLVSLLKTKYILVSYSTEGIIHFDDMLKVLAEKGKVGIVTTGYVRFRGGRQSNQTKNKNIEFVLIVDTGVPSTTADLENVKEIIFQNNILNILDETFPIFKFSTNIPFQLLSQEEKLFIYLKKYNLVVKLTERLKIDNSFLNQLELLSHQKKRELYGELFSIFSYSVDEEINWILDVLAKTDIKLDKKYFINRIITLFNKINPKKNDKIFEQVHQRILEEDYQHGYFRFHSQTKKKLEKIINLKKAFFISQRVA